MMKLNVPFSNSRHTVALALDEEEAVLKAKLEQAFHCIDCSFRALPDFLLVGDDKQSRQFYNFYHAPAYRIVSTFICLIYLLITFFEVPSMAFCAGNTIGDTMYSELCASYQNTPRSFALIIEIFILVFQCFDTWTQSMIFGKTNNFNALDMQNDRNQIASISRNRKYRLFFKILLISTIIIDLIACEIFKITLYRFTRFMRPAFLIMRRKRLRNMCNAVLSILLNILAAVACLVVVIYFFAVMGVLFLNSAYASSYFTDIKFHPTPGMGTICSAYVDDCNDYFNSVPSAFYHLWYLAQKPNWPQVMLPYYKRAPITAVYFIFFLIICHFIFFRLVLAAGYLNYKKYVSEELRRKEIISQQAREQAFELLCETRLLLNGQRVTGVSVYQWQQLIVAFKSKLSDSGDGIFDSYNTSNSGLLSQSEFYSIVRVLDDNYYKSEDNSNRYNIFDVVGDDGSDVLPHDDTTAASITHSLPAFRRLHSYTKRVPIASECRNGRTSNFRKSIRKIIEFPLTEYFIDLLIVASSLRFLLIVSWDRVQPVSVLDVVIVVVFASEIALRVFAYGFLRYWRNSFNKLDSLIVLFNSFSLVIRIFLPQWVSTAYQGVLVLRLLRLCRIFRILHRFPVLIATIKQILPLLIRIMSLLVLLFFAFAVVGMQLYSGLLSESNVLVHQSSMGNKDLYAFNFNSLPQAYVTLFHIFFGPSSPVVLEGLLAATQGSAATYLYFIIFNIFCTIAVTNLLIAFVLEAFWREYSEIETDKKTELVDDEDTPGALILKECSDNRSKSNISREYQLECELVELKRKYEDLKRILNKNNGTDAIDIDSITTAAGATSVEKSRI